MKAFPFTWLLLACSAVAAEQEAYTPKSGSPEREAIMDVMRLDFYPKLAEAHRNSQRVFFKVYFLRVHGDWALADVHPVDRAGREAAEPRWGLLHHASGKWSAVQYGNALDEYESKYESTHRAPPGMNDFDAIDMSGDEIRELWQIFPDIPRDIFPRPEGRPSGRVYNSITN